jgi:hypothetical protein
VAANKLHAFTRLVAAQSGKGIPDDAAAMLAAFVANLLADL